LYQRESQQDQAFTKALQRLGDVNPAVCAGAVIDLVNFYRYKAFFGLGSRPYKKQSLFLLQNVLKKKGEEDFVRQVILETLLEIGSNALASAQLKDADLSNLDLIGTSFRKADLYEANFSGATAAGPLLNGKPAVSFDGASLTFADIRGVEFWAANLRNSLIERA
jgi:hypothetical protein